MNRKLVSIIIPTYNRSHLLGETLDSVLSQTYLKWECLVVDDGSNDYTDELMEFYCELDERIRYYRRPNHRSKGANACRNYGFELSKGAYIQWLDSDDLISKNKLEEQVRLLEQENEDAVAICKWASFKLNFNDYMIESKPEKYSKVKTPFELFEFFGYYGGFMAPHAYLVCRNQVIKAGNWDEFLIINQDGEFFSRLLLKVDKILYSHSSLVFYRKNIENTNTSICDSKKKVEHLILSWHSIELSHKIKYKAEKISFIENAKKEIFLTLERTGFLKFGISEFPNFFIDQIKARKRSIQNRNPFIRLYRKLLLS